MDGDAIEWCGKNMAAHFAKCGSEPPLVYSDRTFDCVYAISVFTHLSDAHQIHWLREIYRIVTPGGILMMTVHGEGCWRVLPDEDVAALRRRGFLFKTSSKLRGIVPDWYHTSFHSREYVLRTAAELGFRPLSYLENGLGYQDLVILER